MSLLFANWKMYLNVEQSEQLARDLCSWQIPSGVDITIFPNTLAYKSVKDILIESEIKIGTQNVAWAPQGAYTGATSALMFKEEGATYALVGHSERRYIFGESDDDIRKKIEACLQAGIVPVLCIGETAEDQQNNKRQYRLKKQLMKALEGLSVPDNKLIIAYEPVWAISATGVGRACLPADVEDVAGWIQMEIAQYGLKNVPILYGGSVNKDSVSSFVTLPSISGVLVGMASTNIDSLRAMVTAIQ